MDSTTETRVATPAEMVEAWEIGVMGGNATYAAREVAAHRPTIPDPTYHREEGWHSASEIRSESAMASMRAHLLYRGLRVPEATEAAWVETARVKAERRVVEEAVESALRAADPAPDAQAYAEAVRGAMDDLLGKTYDHDARPDDDPEEGDRCKDCGEDITWVGPGTSDWLHVDDKANR